MVLRAAGARGLDLRTLRAAVGTRSVWTVDLAHLLARFGSGSSGGEEKDGDGSSKSAPLVSSITLTTTWAGANPAYAGEAFYAATLEADRARVGALFARAPGAGVAVQTRRVPAAELGARLAGGRTAVIALVDKGALARGISDGSGGGGSSPAHHHPLFRLGAAWGAPPPPPLVRPPATPDRRPRSAAAPSPPSPPPVERASPRLAVRRRLSTSSSSGGGGGVSVTTTTGPAPLASVSVSASPEPLSTCPGDEATTTTTGLTASPPLPAGCAAPPSATTQSGVSGYLGHYIVVTAYDPASHTFTLRDPAGGPGVAAVGGDALDAARWAWGTDEDLLLVEVAG
jgi:hypothetical protein